MPDEPEDATFTLKIDRGENGGTISFADSNELTEYLQQEMINWQWLANNQRPGTQYGNNIFAHHKQVINPFIGSIPAAMNHPDDGQVLNDKMDDAFRNFVVLSKDSPHAAYVHKVRDEHGDAAALGTLMGFLPDVELPPGKKSAVWFGLFLSGQFRQNISNDSIDAQKEYFQRSQEVINETLNKAKSNAIESFEAIDDRLEKSELRLRALKRAGNSLADRWNRQNIASVNSSVDQINETDRVYRDLMQLKAPVEYWTKKEKKHKDKAVLWGIASLIYAIVSVLGIVGSSLALFGDVKNLLEATAYSDPTLAFFIGGFFITIITIIFWVGRIIVRIYLSEEHLAIDAKLRATMVETYLALSNEGKAAAEDRIVILTALFRPASDGIVKDDAAPFMSLAAALSKQN